MRNIHANRPRLRLLLPYLALMVLCITACADRGAIRPAPPSEAAYPHAVGRKLPAIRYSIQVGAFSTAERAARYARRMGSHGLDAYHFIDTDGLHKVRFERFDTKAAARYRAAALQTEGVIGDYYIVQPGPADRDGASRTALQAGLVDTAYRFIGTPYRWGGTSMRTGFDCSGLTMTAYRLNGMELPRTAASQFRAGTPVAKTGLERGDLVFFETGGRGRVSHVGIYSGNGTFVHAPGRGKHIRTASLSNSYFKSRYVGARRYF